MEAFEFPGLEHPSAAWDDLSLAYEASKVLDEFYTQHLNPLPTDWVHYAVRLFDAFKKEYVQFPFDQRRYLMQIYNCGKERILLNFARQSEKCVVKHSKISKVKGRHELGYELAEDIRVGDKVASMAPGGRIVSGEVAKVFHNGRLPFIRIGTTSNSVIEVTRSHGILTPNGMAPAGQLELGNQVMARSADLIRRPLHVDNEFVSSVEDIGEHEAIDFEVLPWHNFLVDGVVTHNSTTLSNMAFTFCCLYASFKALYVAPTDKHVTRFSRDRLADVLSVSPKLRKFTNRELAASVTEKGFTNMSRLILRYCYHTADSVRGIPGDLLMVDELASINRDHIPVMEECLSHSPYAHEIFAGTPTTIDSAMGYYWMRSTQNEWAIPCHRHIPRYWNDRPGEKNIGKHCLVCEKCGEQIHTDDEQAQWVAMYKDADWEGFHVPQIIVPSAQARWDRILYRKNNYTTQRFKNEVMAEFADEGNRPVTRQDLIDCCDPDLVMGDLESKEQQYFQSVSASNPVFMGLDWSGGGDAFTVLTLGGYVGTSKFKVFYLKRFEGREADPIRQLEVVEAIAQRYHVHTIGADFGAGFVQNEHLKQAFAGEKYFMEFYYSANPKNKFAFAKGTNRFILHRSQMLSNLFSIIKMKQITFPCWADFEQPFAQDILNVSAVYNQNLRMIVYEHPQGMPDDSLHSILYCLLASFREFPRMDLFGTRSIPTI